jgi:arylformamidase
VIPLALATALVCACSYDIDSPPVQPGHNRLDLYAAPQARSRPVVVYVHGGGWMEGDKGDAIRRKARRFTRAGYVFASINYRLSSPAPETGDLDPERVWFPDHPHDVGEAIGWLSRNVAGYGGDPQRIVLIGHSSGAHLAGLVATDPAYLKAYDVPRRTIRGVVSLDTAAYEIAPLADPTREGSRGIWSVFGTPEEDAATGSWEAASPLHHADRRDPPFLIVSRRDAQRSERAAERRMARRLGPRAGWRLRVQLDHMAIDRTLGARTRLTRRVLRFVRSVSARRPA